MTYQPFPSAEKLRTLYQDIFDNEAVTAVSHWTETNSADATDDAAYLVKALETGEEILNNIDRAIGGIRG